MKRILSFLIFLLPIVGLAQTRLDVSQLPDQTKAVFNNEPAIYEGFVATRGRVPYSFNSTNKQFMSRSVHFSSQALTQLKIVVPNFWVAQNRTSSEVGVGGVATVTASVEYPSGTFTQIKFSGSATGTIADNSTLTSDYVSIAIPTGTEFWIRMYYQNPAGIIFETGQNTSALGGGGNGTVSGGTDLTMTSGSIFSSSNNLSPLAIIGYTNKSSIIALSDSRGDGQNDTVLDATGNYGDITKSFGLNYGYVMETIPSQTLNDFLLGSANQQSIWKYASHIVNAYQFNDFWGDAITPANAIINSNRVIALAHSLNKKIYNITVGPQTTSTDSWATTTNQTIVNSGDHTNIVTYNTYIRAGNNGQDGYIDIASINESSLNSGLWAVNGTTFFSTSDGIHESSANNQLIASSGLLPAVTFLNKVTIPDGGQYIQTGKFIFNPVVTADTHATFQPGTGNVPFLQTANFFTNTNTFIKGAIGSTQTDGIFMQNNTAATSGTTLQRAPNLRIGGSVWNTTATAAANQFDWIMAPTAVSGATPTTSMQWYSSLVTSTTPSYTPRMTLDNSATLTLGVGGRYQLSGSSSGVISFVPQAAAGTYNFNLPITAGSDGQALLSKAGGATAMIWGSVPITQATADLTAQTAAGNITTFTVGASTATFLVSAYLNITAVTTDVIETQVTYTDENSTSQTANFFTQGATSALLSTIGNSVYPPMSIRAKNATVITVKTTLTTGAGSITFDAGARITQQ